MPLCTATTVAGNPCTKNASANHNGLCSVHGRQVQRAAEAAAAVAQAAATAEAENAAARVARITENIARQDRAPAGSPDDFHRYARLIADLWTVHRVPTNLLAQAYCAVKKTSVQHVGWAPLLRAVAGVINLAYFNVDMLEWSDISDNDKNNVFEVLQNSLNIFPTYNVISSLKIGDRVREEAVRRRQEMRAAAEAAAAAAAQAAAAAAAQAAQNPAVQAVHGAQFVRDPEGGINLGAFARDTQSTHRSSVQDGTRKAIPILIARSVDATQETLTEILLAFDDRSAVRFSPRAKEQCIMEITNDYYNIQAFNAAYGDVLDRIWMYIKTHAECKQLIRRLAQEVIEGVGMCENGKMTHLVNVLYAYDPEITALLQNEAPPREAFQAKFATLLNRPVSERAAAATEIFNDYRIPEAERQTWLAPMLETD